MMNNCGNMSPMMNCGSMSPMMNCSTMPPMMMNCGPMSPMMNCDSMSPMMSCGTMPMGGAMACMHCGVANCRCGCSVTGQCQCGMMNNAMCNTMTPTGCGCGMTRQRIVQMMAMVAQRCNQWNMMLNSCMTNPGMSFQAMEQCRMEKDQMCRMVQMCCETLSHPTMMNCGCMVNRELHRDMMQMAQLMQQSRQCVNQASNCSMNSRMMMDNIRQACEVQRLIQNLAQKCINQCQRSMMNMGFGGMGMMC